MARRERGLELAGSLDRLDLRAKSTAGVGDQYVELRVELGAVRSLSARVEQLPMLDAGQR